MPLYTDISASTVFSHMLSMNPNTFPVLSIEYIYTLRVIVIVIDSTFPTIKIIYICMKEI